MGVLPFRRLADESRRISSKTRETQQPMPDVKDTDRNKELERIILSSSVFRGPMWGHLEFKYSVIEKKTELSFIL